MYYYFQMDPLDQIGDPSKGQYGVLKIQTSPLGTESASGTDLNGKQDIDFVLDLFRRIFLRIAFEKNMLLYRDYDNNMIE